MVSVSKTRSTVYLSAARFLGIAVQLVSIPIVWDVLGAAGLGACFFLIALGRWVNLIDLGFHDGTQRRMTQAFDSGEEATAFSAWNTYRVLLVAHAVLGVLVFVALSLFVRVPDIDQGVALRPLFLAAGAMFAGQYLYFGASIYFNARRQFGYLAVSNGAQTLLSALGALGLVLWLRRPEAYLYGFAIGNGIVALFNFGTAAQQANAVRGASLFDREAFRYSLRFGVKLYITRVAAAVTSTFDRVLVTNALGASAVAPYGTAARIPEAGQEVLPVNQTVLPDFTKAHGEGPKAFSESVEKNTLTVFAVSCAAILVPCSISEPILQVWLGDKHSTAMSWVMLLLGAYAALQMLYSSLASAMIAHGSPQKVLPFTLYNAVALLALAYPAALLFGIVGVAALRLGIHVLQFVPIVAFTQSTVAPQIKLTRWTARLCAILAVASAFVVLGVLLWQLPSDWVAVLLAPLLSGAFLLVCHFLNIAPLPDSVQRRLPYLAKTSR